MSKLIDDIKKLEDIASRRIVTKKDVVVIKEVHIKPRKTISIIGPSRRSIDVYDSQPESNQLKIIRNFMEVENAREEIRTRIQSQRRGLVQVPTRC